MDSTGKQVLGGEGSGRVLIDVTGRPRTKGSLKPVHVKVAPGKCRVSLTESGEYSKAWLAQIKRVIKLQCEVARYAGPVVMDTFHRFERLCGPDLAGELDWPTRASGEWAHGDDDKLRRQDGDALEQSGLILNDANIVGGRTWKRWCGPHEVPGVLIGVRPATRADLDAILHAEQTWRMVAR